MAGQDAVNAAKAFNDALALTGVILTKADGDARGGAALSVRQVTGKPILFVGTGEKSEALELFQPERIASRILGMGDVLSLVEQVQSKSTRKSRETCQEDQQGQELRFIGFARSTVAVAEKWGVCRPYWTNCRPKCRPMRRRRRSSGCQNPEAPDGHYRFHDA